VDQQVIAAAGLTADQLDALAQAVYAKCDPSDGLGDGVIDDPRHCAFSPASDLPRCTSQAGPGCFTASQVEALTAIYRGRQTADPHSAFGIEEKQADLSVSFARRAVAADFSNHFAHFALAVAHVVRKDIPAFRSAAERALALNSMDGFQMGKSRCGRRTAANGSEAAS
jgi:hypothetical protein